MKKQQGIRALNLRAPFADLIATGLKRWEWRTWSTPYRGRVAIVQSGLGVVGVADLVHVQPHGTEHFAWLFLNARRVEIVPMKGKLNLWHLPPGTPLRERPFPYRGKLKDLQYTTTATEVTFHAPPGDTLASHYIACYLDTIRDGTAQLDDFHAAQGDF